MDFVIRPTGAASSKAVRLLSEALSALTLPPSWTCEGGPLKVVLTAPEPELPEGTQGYARDEQIKRARAVVILRAACEGRDDIRPNHFSVGRA
jgi:hypothetical protein